MDREDEIVELVENAAEADASAGRAPNAQTAIHETVERLEALQGWTMMVVLTERYGLHYGAKRAKPEEASEVVVRRWRGLEGQEG